MNNNRHIRHQILFGLYISVLFVNKTDGYLLDNAIRIDRRQGISKAECENGCNKYKQCTISIYDRKFFTCENYNVDEQTDIVSKIVGKWISRKHVDDLPESCSSCGLHEECDVHNDGMVTCVGNSCGPPPTLTGATTIGNIYTVNSIIKYQCTDIADLFVEISCQQNGSWSEIDLVCSCVAPVIPNGKADVVKVNDDQFEANVTCNTDFELRQLDESKLICAVDNNIWTNIDKVYCDHMVDGQWRKVYSYPQERRGNIIPDWAEGNNPNIKYSYRNATFIDNWNSMPLKDIKLSIVKDNEEVAFIYFDGRGSNLNTWFDKSRIINSSWDDLSSATTLAHMSWTGIYNFNEINKVVFLRRFIAKVLDQHNCNQNTGWLVVTYSHFPCNLDNTELKVLYSKGKYACQFLRGENLMEIADRYEVWVN